MKYELCKISEIPSEGTKLVDFFGREVHVYKTNGRPRAVANTCMHFGGPLDYQDGKFVCQWHNAEFGCEHGERLAGPAPSSAKLMFLSTRVEDDALFYVWGE
ncbi:MAG: Rieske (2Fe-2S) protein [Chloroflexi bacterium]|nr:MAG: Rieske (2Fe-2S) protein [Chloroflexota bacterium]